MVVHVKGFQKNLGDRSEIWLTFSIEGAFKKMTAKLTTFDHISALETCRDLILVSISMFLGSRNPIK